MNDRIRKLALQAGYRPLPGFDFANGMEEVFIAKFAELLVRECASLAYDGPDGILDYFGVEE